MPEQLEVRNILNEFIGSCEYADEYYWQAFEIHDYDEQQKIEDDTAGYIVHNLLAGVYLDNVEAFDRKMHLKLLIATSSANCDTPEEILALKKCCYDLRLLA